MNEHSLSLIQDFIGISQFPTLQFAAAHLGYLRLCLEMCYHRVLTASGADKTCVIRTSPVSGEKCQLFKAAASTDLKIQDSLILEMKAKTTELFGVSFLFILWTAVSGKVIDLCVLSKFDKFEFVISFYSYLWNKYCERWTGPINKTTYNRQQCSLPLKPSIMPVCHQELSSFLSVFYARLCKPA